MFVFQSLAFSHVAYIQPALKVCFSVFIHFDGLVKMKTICSFLPYSDLQVKRRKSSAHTELQCHSSCDVIDPPSYVWYKNGQKIEEETSLRVSVGGDDSSYSCAVKGHEGYRSAAVCEFTPQCHYEMSCNM